jgi:hypothetical protein
MTQIIVEEDESTSELELDTSSELQQNNPFEEKDLDLESEPEKTFDDFNNKINEFDSLIDQAERKEDKQVEKTWMDTIIDNKCLIFTTINVLSFCYGAFKFSSLKKQHVQLSKELLENIERTKELDLNLFRVEHYTKYLLKQQQNKWVKR